jgi:hypothetical protein
MGKLPSDCSQMFTEDSESLVFEKKKIQFSWSTGALGQVWMDSMPITLRIIQQIKAGEYQSDFLDMG